MKKINWENKIFLLIVLLILFGGFIRPLIFPKDINYLENRTAEQVPKFSFNEFLTENFQNKYEEALADQVPLALKMKETVRDLSLKTKLLYYNWKSADYNSLGNNIFLFKDALVYGKCNLNLLKKSLDKRIDNINKAVLSNNDIDFYVYYIEKDVDIDFRNNEKSGVFEYFKKNLNREINLERFEITDFDEYRKKFYVTDHHWNYIGSYQGYLDLVSLFNLDNPLEPINEGSVTNKFFGSKSTVLGSKVYGDDFYYYKFDMPYYDLKVDGKSNQEYDAKISFYNDTIEEPAYWLYYGGDHGLLEFDYHQTDKENLLIIGDSYDNAINDLLSSHFNKTYNIDLRHYENAMGISFNLNKFIKEHDIDKVLIIGSLNFYVDDEFALKGEF